jgi:hypothetical protein
VDLEYSRRRRITIEPKHECAVRTNANQATGEFDRRAG